jgi:hypothetical protein
MITAVAPAFRIRSAGAAYSMSNENRNRSLPIDPKLVQSMVLIGALLLILAAGVFLIIRGLA